jgi:hypothetical protein
MKPSAQILSSPHYKQGLPRRKAHERSTALGFPYSDSLGDLRDVVVIFLRDRVADRAHFIDDRIWISHDAIRSPGALRPSQTVGSKAASGLSGWRAYASAVAFSSASQSAFKMARRSGDRQGLNDDIAILDEINTERMAIPSFKPPPS